MKVCITMFYDDNIKDYGNINYEITKKYCEKHNLDLILSTEKQLPDRHSAWERLPLLLDNISKFDYLIWIDADAFFYNSENNIIDIIHKNNNVDFIFSKDIGGYNINTGVFIVKNSQYCIDFLTRWAYDEDLYRCNPYPHYWDQGVLIDMFNKNILDIANHSVQMEYGVLQHFNDYEQFDTKPYIFHLAGKSHTTRYDTSKKYLDETFLL